ncbi:hypothetical protein B0J12DRAFT_696358 [Macrophomina phaseolina]|uniref:CUB domain-containing protein n=1 Tax=Macrophomina phaseolina TaxID=35725 RepID=A0ABQ8GJT7_9PEZI|nr:hypothetical protein B0J12DRAFT_696358 [Macrophomina phaseolina]
MEKTLRAYLKLLVVVALSSSIQGHPTGTEGKEVAHVDGPVLEKRTIVDSTRCSVLATCPEGGTQIQEIEIQDTFVDSGRDGSGSCQWRLGGEQPPRCFTRLTFSQTNVPAPPTYVLNTARLQWSVNRGNTRSCSYTWGFRVAFQLPTRNTGALEYLEGSSSVSELCVGGRDLCAEVEGASPSTCRIDLTGCDLPNWEGPP